MLSSIFLLSLLFASTSSAVAVESRKHHTTEVDGLHRRTFTMKISAAALNLDLLFLGKPESNLAVAQIQLDTFTTESQNGVAIALAPRVLVNATHDYFFEYCYPINIPLKKSILQLHHGLVATHEYWSPDLKGPNGTLSFVRAAAEEGYATLSYDALCVGDSDHADGTQDCQVSYAGAVSVAISKAIRDGSLSVGKWSSVVGVGHSFGSATLTSVAATAPKAFDGLVLTGFTANATASNPLGFITFQTSIASVVDQKYYGKLPTDYWSTGNSYADLSGFFHYPNFAPEALKLFSATKGALTQGQMATFATIFRMDRSNYTQPLLAVTGERDGIFCTGNCLVSALSLLNKTQIDTTAYLFPAVPPADFASFMVPEAGHEINFHYNAPAAYSVITPRDTERRRIEQPSEIDALKSSLRSLARAEVSSKHEPLPLSAFRP